VPFSADVPCRLSVESAECPATRPGRACETRRVDTTRFGLSAGKDTDEPKQREDETNDKYNDRHDRWQERCARVHNVAEVNIAKQRHGPIGTVELFFDGLVTKFANLVRDDQIPHVRE